MDKLATAADLPEVLDCQAVMDCISNHLAAIREFEVYSLALFGSVARNEATANSDLDFLVEFSGPATFHGYMGLKFFLEDLFDRSVDLVIKKDLKAVIRDTVIEEAVNVA